MGTGVGWRLTIHSSRSRFAARLNSGVSLLMSPIEALLIALGGNIVLLGAAGWLVRSLVNKLLQQDLEKHKSKLALESHRQIEHLKHELQLSAFERQVTLSKLHEKRAEVIALVYSRISTAYMESATLVSPIKLTGGDSPQQEYVRAMNAMARFFRYFERNKIYVPESTCAQIEELVRGMRSKVIGIGSYLKYDDARLPPAALDRKLEKEDEAWDYFHEKVPAATRALERDLRVLLGEKPASSRAS